MKKIGGSRLEGHCRSLNYLVLYNRDLIVRGTVVTKAPLRVQFLPALGGRGWERVKAEASPRLY